MDAKTPDALYPLTFDSFKGWGILALILLQQMCVPACCANAHTLFPSGTPHQASEQQQHAFLCRCPGFLVATTTSAPGTASQQLAVSSDQWSSLLTIPAYVIGGCQLLFAGALVDAYHRSRLFGGTMILSGIVWIVGLIAAQHPSIAYE